MIHNIKSLDGMVDLNVELLPVFNFALQQNGIRFIKNIIIKNNSDTPLNKCELHITSNSSLVAANTQMIDFILPYSTIEMNDIQLIIDGEQLAGVTERTSCSLNFELFSGSELILKDSVSISVLAYDEWQGGGMHPELLCAFVTPNNPEISKIISKATLLLGKWTDDPSFDAYQSKDPNRVLQQAAAVYETIRNENITYCVSPASFEEIGQRVRLSDTIMSQKLGNCLDLSLLYASVLEAIGLNPLLILTKNHAFAGVWLSEKTYSDAAFDDASAVSSLFADGIGEVSVVECTAAVNGKSIPFDQAVTIAKGHFLESSPVLFVIDVKRSRLEHIHPLPRRVLTESGWIIDEFDSKNVVGATAPNELHPIVDVKDDSDNIVTKKDIWERKLLDLGLRNSLINMRYGAVVPLLSASIDNMENALSSKADFYISPKPSAVQKSEENSFEAVQQIGELGQLLEEELKNGRIHSLHSSSELNSSIKKLYRVAKTALEESGANTLYLALGLLKWYENIRSTKARYAPLIMIPIEMVKKSAAMGYVIRLREEDPQVNITLLEKLRQDFKITIGGVDPLPTDEAGIDTRKVFTAVRMGIKGMKNWEVLESAYIGNFSFTQFVMWNDLRNHSDELSKNLIVKSLMDRKLAWEPEEMTIGDEVNENVLVSLPADSSQLYAIDAACNGKSFVLHGPPGTGKSQTITALIGNALANGKRVLFVAEKMAALEVVQKRLNDMGIGEFCLELHSNKSVKKNVIEHLRIAADAAKCAEDESFERKANALNDLRHELGKYANELHKRRKCGLSIYELINLYCAHENAPEIEPFAYNAVKELSPIEYDEKEKMVNRLITAAQTVGHPANHPLQNITATAYSQEIKFSLPGIFSKYSDALNSFISSINTFCNAVNLRFGSREDCLQSVSIAGELPVWGECPNDWAVDEDLIQTLNEVIDMCKHSITEEKDLSELSELWNNDFFNLPGGELLQEYYSLLSKWAPIKLIGLHQLSKRLSVYAKQKIKGESLKYSLGKLVEYQTEHNLADALRKKYQNEVAFCSMDGESDWHKLLKIAIAALESHKSLLSLTGDQIFRLNNANNSQIRIYAKKAVYDYITLKKTSDELEGLIPLTFEENKWLESQVQFCENYRNHSSELKEWILWNSIASESNAIGLNNVVNGYLSGLKHDDVLATYKKCFAKSAIIAYVDGNETMRDFSGASFNEKIVHFKKIDEEYRELAKKEIRYKISANLPNMLKEAAQSSEIGILQRAIRNNGRGLSIRRLFEQIPNLLPRLCPCMLMSPISVAQYLDSSIALFDIVVFDEASQLPTCKAIGALARGKSAIIVGDPNQMPPTSFFTSNTLDEDNIDEEDMESILQECLALGMPQTHLLWHYRSRHESLIAFSNREFYENKLFTFPSVNAREMKVKLVHVDGVFEHGKARINKKEAEAVVQEVIRRFEDPLLKEQSIGIVTFNVTQQNYIDDLLSEACGKNELLDKWVNNSKEPLFIKNLENVQGDERDVILFSIAYGPDSSGRVSMNFGPLNREGGWRRLNVAVSRARSEMMVFSTLSPDQIDLTKTNARGVEALKSFLKFATGQDNNSGCDFSSFDNPQKSGVVDSICETLNKNGYKTDKYIGHSKYHVDIGVVDPNNPERYALGILLDGDTYSESKSVRDREVGQIDVLTNLGWNIIRIWSMDWWDDKKKETARIINRLKGNIEDEPSKVTVVPMEDTHSLQSNVHSDSEIQQKNNWCIEMYQKSALVGCFMEPNDIDDSRYERTIIQQMEKVIEVEAPICEKLMFKRVVQSFGISRVGPRIQEYLERITSSISAIRTIEEGTPIYWSLSQDPTTYYKIRRNNDADAARDVREICLQERINAICYVLDEQISLLKDDLLREAAKVFGYSRMGTNVVAALDTAIEKSVEKNLIEIGKNGKIQLTSTGEQFVQIAKHK